MNDVTRIAIRMALDQYEMEPAEIGDRVRFYSGEYVPGSFASFVEGADEFFIPAMIEQAFWQAWGQWWD